MVKEADILQPNSQLFPCLVSLGHQQETLNGCPLNALLQLELTVELSLEGV